MRANEAELNNFKAHRAQLLDEVSIVNAELTEALQKKEEAEASCARAVRREKEAEDHLAFLLVDLRDAEEMRSQAHAQALAQFEQNRKDTETAQLAVAQADAYVLSLGETKKNLETDITGLQQSKVERAVELATLNESYSTLCLNIEARQKEHREWQAVAKKEQEDAEALLTATKYHVMREEDKLSETKDLITEEIKKIEEPGKKLARDFAFIERRRRNVDVYAARVKQKHSELYPDKPFTI